MFNEAFSLWMAENFKRLTVGSIKLLDALSVDSFIQVKLSTVTTFSTDPEEKAFKRLAASFEDLSQDKLNVLDSAIKHMHRKNSNMPLRSFRDAVSIF